LVSCYPVHRQRAQRDGDGLHDQECPHVIPHVKDECHGDEDRLQVLRDARRLAIVQGALHEAAVERVPHRLVDVREIGGEGVERRVPLQAIRGEEKNIGQDQGPE
jgi:hypothetical protein